MTSHAQPPCHAVILFLPNDCAQDCAVRKKEFQKVNLVSAQWKLDITTHNGLKWHLAKFFFFLWLNPHVWRQSNTSILCRQLVWRQHESSAIVLFCLNESEAELDQVLNRRLVVFLQRSIPSTSRARCHGRGTWTSPCLTVRPPNVSAFCSHTWSDQLISKMFPLLETWLQVWMMVSTKNFRNATSCENTAWTLPAEWFLLKRLRH